MANRRLLCAAAKGAATHLKHCRLPAPSSHLPSQAFPVAAFALVPSVLLILATTLAGDGVITPTSFTRRFLHHLFVVACLVAVAVAAAPSLSQLTDV